MVFKCFSEGFLPGSVVTVKGYVHADPDRFEINLQCGPVAPPDIVGDIALHFNPRFDEDMPVIVRNTKTNGRWGYEERDGGFFFTPNTLFHVQISSEWRGYKIDVDNFPFIYYKHRQDFSDVTHMTVRGDIDIQEVYYKPVSRLEDPCYHVPKPPGPFKFELEKKFESGYYVEIKGRVREDIARFSVNLVCGESPESDNEICCPLTVALHYDVIFLPSNCIVMNSMIEGEWKDEETCGRFDFIRGTNFTLRFNCEDGQFQIFVDNMLNGTYKHRIDPQNISYIYIHGEVQLFEISVTNE